MRRGVHHRPASGHVRRLCGWDDSEVSALRTYAGVTARLLGTAAKAQIGGWLADQLQVALDSRVHIKQAQAGWWRATPERPGVVHPTGPGGQSSGHEHSTVAWGGPRTAWRNTQSAPRYRHGCRRIPSSRGVLIRLRASHYPPSLPAMVSAWNYRPDAMR
jgi:hypothetical protein